MGLIPQNEVWDALGDALAIAREFDGATITEKLAGFGLDASEVSEVVATRWSQARNEGHRDATAFAAGFVEGLIAGVVLTRA